MDRRQRVVAISAAARRCCLVAAAADNDGVDGLQFRERAPVVGGGSVLASVAAIVVVVVVGRGARVGFLGFLGGAGVCAGRPGKGLGRGATIATAVVAAVASGGDVRVIAAPVAMHCNVQTETHRMHKKPAQHNIELRWQGSQLKIETPKTNERKNQTKTTTKNQQKNLLQKSTPPQKIKKKKKKKYRKWEQLVGGWSYITTETGK